MRKNVCFSVKMLKLIQPMLCRNCFRVIELKPLIVMAPSQHWIDVLRIIRPFHTFTMH